MLKITNFSKVYNNGKVAIENLNLSIEPGDIYAFVGTNGSGKTSTIKAIVGIHDFNGEILVNGKKVSIDDIEYKKDIAYIPDNPDVYENLTGHEYINFIANLYEVEKQIREEKIEYFSNLFKMQAFLNDKISTYSHGMKQKIVIISALIHSPKLLIMDEPFVGLDPKSTFLLKEEMKNIASNGGAIFFSTHILEVAEKLCNKLAMIDNGHLIIEGRINEILKNKDSLEKYFMEMID